jgi:hypothetical protein
MTNLTVRRHVGDLHRPSTEAERFRLINWDPFHEMAPFWPEDQPARFLPDRFLPDFEVM